MDDKDEDRLDHVDLTSEWEDDELDLEDTVFAPRQRRSLQKAFNLELMEDSNVTFSDRPLIPATSLQILCYLRSYVCSLCKIEILCMQNPDFNIYFWSYVMNVLFKSLPSAYLYVFLGSYAPDHHLFLSKMIPLFYGLNWIFIIAGFLDLLVVNDLCGLLADYIVKGLMAENPWSECPQEFIVRNLTNGTSATMKCLNISSFMEKVNGTTQTTLFEPIGYSIGNETFQLAEIAYFQDMWIRHSDCRCGWDEIYSIPFWCLVILFNGALYKKRIWMIHHFVQWMLIGIYVVIFVDLYYETTFDLKENKFTADHPIEKTLHKVCIFNSIGMLSESLTAPPILHVLSARRSKDIKPTRDAAFITINNAIYFFLLAVIRDRMRIFCNNLIGVPMYASSSNFMTFFYTVPVYFSTYTFGHIYVISTFAVVLVNEFFTWAITFHILVEIIVFEWQWVDKITVCTLVSISGALANIYAKDDIKRFLYVVGKILPALGEIFVIYLIYPFGRLLDDVQFHLGSLPSTFEIVFLRTMPFYFLWKTYRIIYSFSMILNYGDLTNPETLLLAFWAFTLAPIVLGALYVIYREVYKKQKSWSLLLVPVPDFGPRDFMTRQLRKIYDSRDYISSRAPRVLSRHLMRKTESKVYNIDIRYENPTFWRSVSTQSHRKSMEESVLRRKSKPRVDFGEAP